ncbi:MAG: hypothetical protein JJ863_34100 [Deltaproteobacteria bacterium]|nr:hypothetical protein [Deltaproteobacteria bacterium]
MPLRFLLASLIVALACDDSPPTDAPAGELRPRSEPIEYVGLAVEMPLATPAELESRLGPLFGDTARGGATLDGVEIQPGLFLSSFPDTRTPDQVVIELAMETVNARDRRTVLRVPASFDYGQLFLDTAAVALTRGAAVEAEEPGSMDPFFLEYRAVSPNGGSLTIEVAFENGAATLEIATHTPETSLQPGLVNAPAFGGEPYEQLAGTVWFTLSRDQFDFFSTRAYGITAGAAQNFQDFRLLPHDWLRLTVTPQLSDEMVNVGFEVVDLDGRRIPFANAPASLLAGEQFRENVFRMVRNMLDQEAAETGSSTRFTVPFHYDDPEGGGVVKVIAQGQGGVFQIAYAVESPRQRLRPVEFLPYQGVLDVPDELPPRDTSCADVGSTEAVEGRFLIRFDASPTVRESEDLTHPLRGNIWGSVYRADDVTLAGPNEGAEAVASFAYTDVDITTMGEGETYPLDVMLPVGEYQLLGFMDVDGNATDEMADPDEGDPVTLPIGGYDLKCAEQPIVVEFALLLPPGR